MVILQKQRTGTVALFRLVLLKPNEYMQIQCRIHQCCSDQWNSNFHPKFIIQPDNWHLHLQTYDSVVENRNHILFYFSCFEDLL